MPGLDARYTSLLRWICRFLTSVQNGSKLGARVTGAALIASSATTKCHARTASLGGASAASLLKGLLENGEADLPRAAGMCCDAG